jgi:hypothetical protein
MKQMERCSIVQTKPTSVVQTIKLAPNAMPMKNKPNRLVGQKAAEWAKAER